MVVLKTSFEDMKADRLSKKDHAKLHRLLCSEKQTFTMHHEGKLQWARKEEIYQEWRVHSGFVAQLKKHVYGTWKLEAARSLEAARRA